MTATAHHEMGWSQTGSNRRPPACKAENEGSAGSKGDAKKARIAAQSLVHLHHYWAFREQEKLRDGQILDVFPEAPKRPRRLVVDRVLDAIGEPDANGCWPWLLKINSNGYGFSCGRPSHRAVWEVLVGEIESGLFLDHLCRNKACVNPDHLDPVTPGENTRRYLATKAAS